MYLLSVHNQASNNMAQPFGDISDTVGALQAFYDIHKHIGTVVSWDRQWDIDHMLRDTNQVEEIPSLGSPWSQAFLYGHES